MPEKYDIGQYYLVDKIAQGGMAEIYKGLAYDGSGIKRTVVIKKILPHIAANKEFVNMLINEAKIAVNLSHGNIAQIYDLGKVGSDYFMVMEFVNGQSLSQIHKRCLKNGDLIPLQYVCYFISEIAQGLHYMHNKTDDSGRSLGIVHRDISPQNIIVSYSSTVKIIDFGIAKAAFKLDYTETGVLKGKFAYMSPEQARGEKIDGRSDIFSLGVILHELISGKRLFKDKDNKITIQNVRKAHVEKPSTYNTEIPKELDDITMKALSKDIGGRYQQAADMRNDLLKFLHTRFPDFNPASVTEFLKDLFKEDIAEYEKETEHTPYLIIDNAESAIRPHDVMKEFMLEEIEKSAEEIVSQEGTKEKAEEGPSLGQRCIAQVKKIEPIISKYLFGITMVFALAAVIYGGGRLGIWRAWSEFLRPSQSVEEKRIHVPAAPQKFAVIIVESTPPGATIFIDDIKTKFATPATIAEMKADDKAHSIGIFLENHRYWATTFTARPDGEIRFNPTLAVAYGSLEVNSDPPGAGVTIDGETTGVTPFTKGEINPATILKIKVEKEGFVPWEKDIKIIPDKTAVLRLQLLRLPGRPGLLPAPKIPEEQAAKEPSQAEPVTEPPEIPTLPPAGIPKGPPERIAEPQVVPQGPVPTPESRETPMELDYR